jgi:regulatory protein
MTKAFECAVRLLARREHGAKELVKKLQQKGYSSAEAAEALAACERQGLQSDARFTESLTRLRIRQGYGPIRIRHELNQLGISTELISEVMTAEEDNWPRYASEVWHKKRKGQKDALKLKRFMVYRGFPMAMLGMIE